ncbi:MAG: hypothetical protein J0H42_19070 [Rhizobiales bacterium]|nr:hypothetical protein [Hyphomicrobiales bacterium]
MRKVAITAGVAAAATFSALMLALYPWRIEPATGQCDPKPPASGFTVE